MKKLTSYSNALLIYDQRGLANIVYDKNNLWGLPLSVEWQKKSYFMVIVKIFYNFGPKIWKIIVFKQFFVIQIISKVWFREKPVIISNIDFKSLYFLKDYYKISKYSSIIYHLHVSKGLVILLVDFYFQNQPIILTLRFP